MKIFAAHMDSSLHTAWLLTGSNLNDREQLLARARELLEQHGCRVKKTSSLYETASWGKEDEPAYLNQALEIETALNARQLMRHILKIEKAMGRIRKEKYAARIIDIDILLYGQEKHFYDLLKLPHPEIPNRRFVLEPMNEIAPDLNHPVLQKTMHELLLACTDPLPVKKYS